MKLSFAIGFALYASFSAFAADDPTLRAVNNDRVSVAICNQDCMERLGLRETQRNNACPPGAGCPKIIIMNDAQSGDKATLMMPPWSGSRHRANDLFINKVQ